MNKNSAWLVGALSVFAVSSTALASTDDPSNSTSTNLVNLIYYAHPGQFLLQPSYTSVFHESNGSASESQSTFNLAVNYGLLFEGLRIGVSEASSVYASNDGSYSYYYSGVGDPTFSLRYRLLDQASEQWSADAAFQLSPSFGSRTIAESGYPGSNHKGYTSMTFVASAYWNYGIDEAELYGSLEHDFVGTASNELYPGYSYTRDALWAKTIAIFDRLHLTPKLFFQAQADFLFSQSVNYGYVNGSSHTNQVPFHVSPHAELGYLPYKQLLLTASMAYNADTQSLTNNNTGTVTQTDFQETSWMLGATIEL